MPRTTQARFQLPRYSGFVLHSRGTPPQGAPTYIAVCFDPPGQTFRNEAFDEYKGRTQCTPEDIKLSVPVIKEIVRAYNIPIVEVEGFEADDVIGTLARCAEKKEFTVYMMTPDKDFRSACEPLPCFSTSHPTAGRISNCGERRRCAALWHRACFTGDRSAGTDERLRWTTFPVVRCGREDGGEADQGFRQRGESSRQYRAPQGCAQEEVEENAENIRFSKFLATIRTDVPVDVGSREPRGASGGQGEAVCHFQGSGVQKALWRVWRADSSAEVRPVPEAGLSTFCRWRGCLRQ